jgi:hypothetical protein
LQTNLSWINYSQLKTHKNGSSTTTTNKFRCAVTYQEFHKGADEVDGVGGEEGVGEEAAKEGEEEGGAHEVGHRRRRLRRRVVHEIHQVGHQVARVRQERQVLEHLHHKNEGGGEHAAVPAAHRRPVPPVDVPLPPLRLPRRRTVLPGRRR